MMMMMMMSKNRQVKSESADLNLIRKTCEGEIKLSERAESSNKASAGKSPQSGLQEVVTVQGQKNGQSNNNNVTNGSGKWRNGQVSFTTKACFDLKKTKQKKSHSKYFLTI